MDNWQEIAEIGDEVGRVALSEDAVVHWLEKRKLVAINRFALAEMLKFMNKPREARATEIQAASDIAHDYAVARFKRANLYKRKMELEARRRAAQRKQSGAVAPQRPRVAKRLTQREQVTPR